MLSGREDLLMRKRFGDLRGDCLGDLRAESLGLSLSLDAYTLSALSLSLPASGDSFYRYIFFVCTMFFWYEIFLNGGGGLARGLSCVVWCCDGCCCCTPMILLSRLRSYLPAIVLLFSQACLNRSRRSEMRG